MALSEEEARLLAQLEQSLAAEDPDFASTLSGVKLQARSRKLVVIGGLGAVAGVAVLLTGAITAYTWVGVLGFVLMVAGAYLFVTAWRDGMVASDEPVDRSPRAPRAGFVDRMEQRWQRRTDDPF